MSREITSHKVNGVNDGLKIEAADEPGSGGANHVYDVTGFRDGGGCLLRFQNGPIKEAGVNGITHEALLAVIIDRLEGFQRGPFACDENADALHFLFKAQATLLARTQRRAAAGIEGTHQPDNKP